eukprot:scaffold20996_cov23-Tisochrysis_lutea.AAC.1
MDGPGSQEPGSRWAIEASPSGAPEVCPQEAKLTDWYVPHLTHKLLGARCQEVCLTSMLWGQEHYKAKQQVLRILSHAACVHASTLPQSNYAASTAAPAYAAPAAPSAVATVAAALYHMQHHLLPQLLMRLPPHLMRRMCCPIRYCRCCFISSTCWCSRYPALTHLGIVGHAHRGGAAAGHIRSLINMGCLHIVGCSALPFWPIRATRKETPLEHLTHLQCCPGSQRRSEGLTPLHHPTP